MAATRKPTTTLAHSHGALFVYHETPESIADSISPEDGEFILRVPVAAVCSRRRLLSYARSASSFVPPPRTTTQVSLTVFLSSSAALRSAGGDLEKAKCIVSSSPRSKPEKKSKAAANSKPRDLLVSMSLEEDEGTPLKQQPGKASGKKRYRGDRLIETSAPN